MSLQISTITAAIAGLTVTGVTILDTDEIPFEVGLRQSVLFPEPVNFVTDFTVTRDSMGIASQARKTVTYTLNYTFAHSQVGTGRGLADLYGDMVSTAYAIVDAIIALDTVSGAVGIDDPTINQFGVVVDPSGVSYHGCKIAVRVTEFVN